MNGDAFWCEHAVLPAADGARIEGPGIDGVRIGHGVRIQHSGGLITAVTTDVPAGERDERLAGLVTPGFANAHSHAFHRALRGRTHADGGSFWNWREQMYRVAALLDPDNYYELATAVFADMVSAGITVVGEFHYVHHRPDGSRYDNANAMADAVLSAAGRAGIRITLLDTLYLRGGLDGSGRPLPLSPRQARFGDGSLEGWQRRHDALAARTAGSATARIGAAIHSLRAVDAALMPAFADLVSSGPLHAHVSEQPSENDQVHAADGRTPTRVFADAGLLGPRFTAVHGTHLTGDDIVLLGSSGSTVCFCPSTERDLGDGIGPALELHRAGVRLCLGTDQNAVIDPYQELRGLELDQRLAGGTRGVFSPGALLRAATANGYAALGWTGGAVEVGEVCDLVATATTSRRTAGAALDQLWFAAGAEDVSTVVVGGSTVVAGGRHRLGEVGSLLAAALEKVGVA
ncbi:formimidoylglutamate deiminase [Parafrigoribacterium mesophilum]|uniref:formimidoylglutamate deiminase n=1 Tax=Parafrigoribacterium mesophilum TaxID=433646 RepID=UPI0031FBE195